MKILLPFETLQLFRKKDFLLIFGFSLLFSFISYLVNQFNSETSFHLRLALFYMILVLSLLFVKKSGSVLFFCIFSSVLYKSSLFQFISFYQALITFIVIGITFEAFFLLLKLEIKNIPLDILLGSAFSSSIISFVLLLFTDKTYSLYTNAFNISAINFFTAIIGASCAFIIWFQIRSSKKVIKFEYED